MIPTFIVLSFLSQRTTCPLLLAPIATLMVIALTGAPRLSATTAMSLATLTASALPQRLLMHLSLPVLVATMPGTWPLTVALASAPSVASRGTRRRSATLGSARSATSKVTLPSSATVAHALVASAVVTTNPTARLWRSALGATTSTSPGSARIARTTPARLAVRRGTSPGLVHIRKLFP